MNKVLIPIDFSDASLNAARYASQLFCSQPTEFILLYANEPVPSKKELTKDKEGKSYSDVELSLVQKELADDDNYPGHVYTKAIVNKDAVTCIVDCADDWQVSSIIMGKTGRTSMVDQWLGGITTDVIKYANKPVIAVPAKFSPSATRHIALATDFEPMDNFEPLDFLLKTLKLTQARFTVLTVQSKRKSATIGQTMTGLQFEKYVDDFPHKYEVATSSSTTDGIINFTIDNGVDLLAMINRDSSFFQSLFSRGSIQKVSQHLRIPLLTLPSPNYPDLF